MNDQRDLTVILKSRFPIVAIETDEEPRVRELLAGICRRERLTRFDWSVVDSLCTSGGEPVAPKTNDLRECLKHIEGSSVPGVYVLFDAQKFLEDPINTRLLRQIALGYEACARTIVIVGHAIDLPPEVSRQTARFELSVPDLAGVGGLLQEVLGERWIKSRFVDDRGVLDDLKRQLVGLPAEDIKRLVRLATEDDGALTRADIPRVQHAKYSMLEGVVALTLEPDPVKLFEVGGLGRLKRWLELRRTPFLDPPKSVTPPKGILLLGVQGSGKSLAARAIAGAWGVALLRFDFGALYEKWSGETEKNLRAALRAARSMAPCVVWMDEIEKGVAIDDAGADGGLSRRVLGGLLTWMNERTDRVFLAATANDATRLPPELLRKGRFDEIFFVDLPEPEVRKEIFNIHLSRRNESPDQFDLLRLAAESEGFSGAELEQAVVAAQYESFAVNARLTTEMISAELRGTRPLSVVMAERVDALRQWAAERCVPAS